MRRCAAEAGPATRRPSWCGVAVAVAALCLGWPAGAAGQPSAPSNAAQGGLRWDAPLGCPDAASVSEEIEQLVGASEDGSHGAAVDGQIVLGSDGYVLQLSIAANGRVESRTVVSEDCQLLARAAALLVAITVDALATAHAITQASERAASAGKTAPPDVQIAATVRPPSVIPEPTAEQAPSEPTRAAEPARAPPGARWRHGVEAGVDGGLGIALVPGITGGLEGQLGWRYGPVRVRALGFHWFGRATRPAGDNGVFAALSGAGLRGCYAVTAGRFEVPLCAGADAGALHGRGIGPTVEATSPVGAWAAVAVSVGVELPIGRRFAVRGRIELVSTVRRPALHLEQGQEQLQVFRAPPFGFRLLLGTSVRSP